MELDPACRTAAALLDAPAALAVAVEAGTLRHLGSCGIDADAADRLVRSAVFGAFVARLGPDPIRAFGDPRDGSGSADEPIAVAGKPVRAFAAAPLSVDDGHWTAILLVLDTVDRPDLDAGAMARLGDVAQLAGSALRAQAARRDAERHLGDSEARLLAIQNARRIAERTACFGHWRIDPRARTVVWSAGIASIFGRNATLEPVALDAHVGFYHPDDRAAIETRIGDALAGHSRLNRGGYEHRSRILRPDGEVRHVSVHGVAERDATGRLTAIHGVCLDVTDLARSEAELRRTTGLLRDTLEAMDQGLVMTDADDRVRVHNRRVGEMMGVPDDLLYDGAPFERVRAHQAARGDFAALPDGLRRWLERGEPEMRVPDYERERADGTVLQVQARELPGGGIVRTFTDVTERRAAERAVRESQRRYRLIAESVSDIIILSDLDTTRRYVSPAVTAILGYAPEDLTGARTLGIVHPDDADAYTRVLDDVRSGRSERALIRQRYRHRDGHWVWMELGFRLTHDEGTGRADGFVSTLRDVSARVAAEDALRRDEADARALAATRLSAALARADFTTAASAAILAQLAEGVIVTDAAGRITLVNTAAAAIHGVARLDVEPDAYSDTYHLFTEDGRPYPPHDLPLARAVRGETVRDARWHVCRPDGSRVTAIGSAQPLLDAEGARIGAVLTLRDDTAREATERSLRESEARLRDLNATLAERVAERTREAEAARELAEAGSRAKSEFLASMSHEIRTPLHGVIGYADLLLDEPGIGARVGQYGARIRSAGAALLTVVNDILDVSKIEAGQVEIVPRPFAPAGLVENTVAMVRGQAEARGLALGVTIDPALPPWLVGDEDRLRQVLLNLLNNAIKFTPTGRIDLTVAAGAGEPEDRVALRFSVRDTGIGIPADKHDRLFRRFSQVDGSYRRAHEGTGLGLAICKSLVELMGGTVGVDSVEGRGSTFHVALDLHRAAAPDRPSSDRVGVAERRSRRLLLAEDVPLNQDLACSLLRAAGHAVDVVADGAEALGAVQAVDYDLVLMDVQMPVMDGVTATRRIRALDHRAAAVPIVALTANVLPQQVAEFRAAGMTGHVGKPFDRTALLDTIDRLARGEGASAPASMPRPHVDQATLDALSEMVGRDKMGGLLATLAEELEGRFGPSAPAADRAQVARDAHAMVTAASMLGFSDLARLCRTVEEACRTGADYAPPLEALRAQSDRAIAEIARLRAA